MADLVAFADRLRRDRGRIEQRERGCTSVQEGMFAVVGEDIARRIEPGGALERESVGWSRGRVDECAEAYGAAGRRPIYGQEILKPVVNDDEVVLEDHCSSLDKDLSAIEPRPGMLT